ASPPRRPPQRERTRAPGSDVPRRADPPGGAGPPRSRPRRRGDRPGGRAQRRLLVARLGLPLRADGGRARGGGDAAGCRSRGLSRVGVVGIAEGAVPAGYRLELPYQELVLIDTKRPAVQASDWRLRPARGERVE